MQKRQTAEHSERGPDAGVILRKKNCLGIPQAEGQKHECGQQAQDESPTESSHVDAQQKFRIHSQTRLASDSQEKSDTRVTETSGASCATVNAFFPLC